MIAPFLRCFCFSLVGKFVYGVRIILVLYFFDLMLLLASSRLGFLCSKTNRMLLVII